MNYHEIKTDDIKNGVGVRVTMWISGCELQCPHCFNPQTWDFNSGKEFNYEALTELIQTIDKPYIQGLTLTGGNPLSPFNLKGVHKLTDTFRRYFGDSKDLWIYTGYTWEELCFMTQVEYGTKIVGQDLIIYGILNRTDVVVDGRYVDELNDVKFPYRGSTNQRLIDVKKSWSGKEQYFDAKDMVEYKV